MAKRKPPEIEVVTDWDIDNNAANATITFPVSGTYNIYRQESGGQSELVDQVEVSKSDLTYVDENLDGDVDYTYTVSKVSASDKEGPMSEPVEVTTPTSDQIDELGDLGIDVEGLDESDLEAMGIADLDLNDPDERQMVMDILSENVGGYLSDEMIAASEGLHSGDDSASEWFWKIMPLLTAGVALAGLIGGGGTRNVSESSIQKIEDKLAEQLDYLEGFRDAISSGDQALTGVDARIGLYVNSLGSVFQSVRTSQAVADGMTMARRVLDETITNHCAECVDEAKRGWIDIDSLVPIGACQCMCITTPESRVLTKRGMVPISEVTMNDEVLTHKYRWREVVGITRGYAKWLNKKQAYIYSKDGVKVGCTQDHSWATSDDVMKDKLVWIQTRAIESRDKKVVHVDIGRQTKDKSWIVGSSSVRVELLDEEPVDIYDITVEEDHSFIVEGMVCHNSNCACDVEYKGDEEEPEEVVDESPEEYAKKIGEKWDFSDDRPTTVAVDLDGTLAKKDWPGIGELRHHARRTMKKLKEKGCRIIIFTVRGDKEQVAKWLKDNDVPYDWINFNPDQPEGSSDKIHADLYVDDKAVNADKPWDDILEKLKDKIGFSVDDEVLAVMQEMQS